MFYDNTFQKPSIQNHTVLKNLHIRVVNLTMRVTLVVRKSLPKIIETSSWWWNPRGKQICPPLWWTHLQSTNWHASKL